MVHLGNQAARPGKCIKFMAHRVLAKHPVSWVGWTREGHKTHSPSGSVALWSTWGPEWLRPGKWIKHRAHLGQCPCRAPWSLSRVDPGRTRRLGLWQTQCGPSTASTPHTCQWYLFAVSLPPHNTTEQVTLNKWPRLPPCVRVEIRHWKDPQTEEGKTNKEGGTALEVTGSGSID